MVVFGGEPAAIKDLKVVPSSVLDQRDGTSVPDNPVGPWDMQSIIYTSGTTGPSKGVMSSYAHLHAMSGAEGFYMLGPNDRYMCNLPLFHVGGTIPVMGMLSRGGSIALVPGTGGIFEISLDGELIWERKRDGGFPDVKTLKQLVRDRIDPDRDLGHIDRVHHAATPE